MAKVVAKTGIKKKPGYLYFLDKNGNVSRVQMARAGKKTSKKVVYPRTLKTAIAFSSLRQEKVKISLRSSKASEKRKGALVWGVE